MTASDSRTITKPFIFEGERVRLHPATDAWMQGDRYGTITKVGRKYFHVKMDSGRTLLCRPKNVEPVGQ